MTPKISEVKMIKVSDLEEFDLNPNTQDPTTFSNLVEEINLDGFDEPLIVVPNEKNPSKFTVISGNHRLKASKVLCFEELPCIIKEDWSLDEQKMKVVRRNMLKGELDAAKFSKLVDSLDANYTPEQLANMMGFNSTDAFERMYLLDTELEQRQNAAIAAQVAEKETNAIDGLGIILNRLFSEYGDTLPHSFMFFDYGNKINIMLLMNSRLKKVIEELTLKCAKEGLDINEVLSACIVEGNKIVGAGDGADLNKIESLRNVKEDYELRAVTND
jgi:hypothetical protein